MQIKRLGATCLLAGTLTLTTAMATATPLVFDNVISWPDNGWYQVLDESDYSEVCGGTTSCEVEAGSYLVINHTTGERFPGISVTTDGMSSEDPMAPFTVSGNTISWLDFRDWHQVQNADTYQTLCEGGSSCTVPAGNYILINHGSGERYTGIVVSDSGSTGPAESDAISVSGSRISWPDDGWYQVQNADTFQNLCEGGNSCEVPPGTYQVINHTTGTRFDPVTVTGDTDDSSPIPVWLSNPDPDAATVLQRIGYEAARDNANDFVSGTYLTPFLEVADPYINENFVLFEEFDNRQFNCPDGGTADTTQRGFASPESTIVFNRCAIGTIELNGNLVRKLTPFVIGSGGGRSVDWEFDNTTFTTSGTNTTIAGTASHTSRYSGRLGAGCTGPAPADQSSRLVFLFDSAAINSATATTRIENARYNSEYREIQVGPVGEPEGPCRLARYVATGGDARVTSSLFGTTQSQITKTGISMLEGVTDRELIGVFYNDAAERSEIDGPVAITASFGDGSDLLLQHEQAVEAITRVTVQILDATSTFTDSDFRVEY